MKNKLSFIILIYFALINTVIAKEKIKVFYSGFSFSNNYESNKIFTQYTKKIVNNISTENKLDIISNNLLKEIKKANFQNINLDLENLLDFRKYLLLIVSTIWLFLINPLFIFSYFQDRYNAVS